MPFGSPPRLNLLPTPIYTYIYTNTFCYVAGNLHSKPQMETNRNCTHEHYNQTVHSSMFPVDLYLNPNFQEPPTRREQWHSSDWFGNPVFKFWVVITVDVMLVWVSLPYFCVFSDNFLLGHISIRPCYNFVVEFS